MKKSQKGNSEVLGSIVILVFVLGVLLSFFLGWPYYKVWKQEMNGKAALAEARQSKMIQVEQARAELDSAQLRADAIKTIGIASQKYPEYRTQEFIGAFGEALREGSINQIIYVPTEGNIPILEAGSRPTIEK